MLLRGYYIILSNTQVNQSWTTILGTIAGMHVYSEYACVLDLIMKETLIHLVANHSLTFLVAL